MIEVHLYGKLRRFADNQNPSSDSIVYVPFASGITIRGVAESIGIPLQEIGSNIFLNGVYSILDNKVKDGDRLGLFPDDMQLLYKWYFNKVDDVSHNQRVA